MNLPSFPPDEPVDPDGPRRPRLLIFDVNETLSDMMPISGRFEDVGAPGGLARTWFTGLLRDGFALTIAQQNPSFADLAAEGLRMTLQGTPLNRSLQEAVEHIMTGFAELAVHPDVPPGIRALAGLGIRLVTLGNGSASIAQQLLGNAGLDHAFESFLSVEQAGSWKPAPGAYAFALQSLKIDPIDAMLVAAHPWDIDGAGRAGLATAWVNRSESAFPAYFRAPTLEADSLSQLAHRLQEAGRA